MVPYNLPNGKTIYISTDKFLDLTEEDIQEYMAEDKGSFIEDPFYESGTKDQDLEEEEDEFDLPEEDESETENYNEFFDDEAKQS